MREQRARGYKKETEQNVKVETIFIKNVYFLNPAKEVVPNLPFRRTWNSLEIELWFISVTSQTSSSQLIE